MAVWHEKRKAIKESSREACSRLGNGDRAPVFLCIFAGEGDSFRNLQRERRQGSLWTNFAEHRKSGACPYRALFESGGFDGCQDRTGFI